MRSSVHDLHYNIQVGSVVAVEELLNSSLVDVNSTVCGSTALSLALYKEKSETFCLLLSHPTTRSMVDVNKLSKDDKQRVEPPLVTACRLGDVDSVRLLLSHREIDIEGQDNFQHTALWMATRQRFTNIVQLLIEHGASVNPSFKWTHSPLFFATKYSSRRTDIAKLLLLNGASVHLSSPGPSLLFCAIVQGNLPMGKLIVEAGYNVSKDKKICDEFSTALLTRNVAFLEWLQQEIHQPPSLQRQCRTVIRQCIMQTFNSRHFLQSLKHLPLPPRLIEYVALVGTSYDASLL
jgi:hypothetical protein